MTEPPPPDPGSVAPPPAEPPGTPQPGTPPPDAPPVFAPPPSEANPSVGSPEPAPTPATPAAPRPSGSPPPRIPPASRARGAAPSTPRTGPPPDPNTAVPIPPDDSTPHLPPLDGTTPTGGHHGPPHTPEHAGTRTIGWATRIAVAVAALVAGVGVGSLLFGSHGGPAPSPSPTPSTSDGPIVATTRLTIPEGYTAERIYERAEEVLGIPVEDFEAAAADPEAIGLPAEANGSIEGWLGPYTYQIPETATATDVLAEMVWAQLLHLDNLGVAPEDRLDVLVRASLVEREVSREQDRPKVARVIQNRLNAGWKLQFDSTVHYAAGVTGEALTTAEQRAIDSPYNTYLYEGLPPGPICSPGDAAMEAVLSPENGSWMYFTTVNLDTGETLFETTLEEHNADVAILQAWLAENG